MNKSLDHGDKGRLWGRRATRCLRGTSRTTAAVGEDSPVSASEIPIARRMQHKMKIRRHDRGLHKPWSHCTLKHVLCPPATGDTALLPSVLSEVRVWQIKPDHRTGLGQLARARTRLSFSVARMQVGVCSARVQTGLRLRSGHRQRGAPPPAPGEEAGLGWQTARPTRAPRSPRQGRGDASSSTVSQDWKPRPRG